MTTSTPEPAAIYLRVSTEDQAGGFSLTEQRERCEGHARSQGWEIVGVFTDEGVSGAKALAERPAGAEMLQEVQVGRVSHIITSKLDRFTRSLVNGANDLEALEAAGVSATFLDLGVNTATDAGKLALRMLMAVADFERTRIANRMSTGRLGRLREGRWPGGPVPYGWTSDDDGYLVRDEEQAPVLLRIFHLVAQGTGTQEVARTLMAEGVAGPSGGEWNHNTIRDLLKRGDEYASGTLTRTQGPKDARETHKVSAPSIVSAEVADRAQKAIARKAKPQVKKLTQGYALTGHLRHLHGVDWRNPEHTAPMRGRSKSNAIKRYMVCDPETCPGFYAQGSQTVKALPAGQLEAATILWGLDLLDDPERIEEWIARFDEREYGGAGEAAQALTNAIKRREALEDRQGEMVKALSKGLLTADALEEAQAEVAEELAETEAAIERLAGAAAKADFMRLGVTRLRSGNLIAYLMEAQVKWPTPADGTDSDAWPQLASWLRSEATEVLEGIRARSGGKPRKDAPTPRDMHAAATEWARAMAAHFHLLLVITDRNDDGSWAIEVDGAFEAGAGSPGTMPAWQRSTNHPTGSPEGMGAQGPSSEIVPGLRKRGVQNRSRHNLSERGKNPFEKG